MQTQQQKKKQKKLFNILMIAMIAVIAFCSVMAVGHIRGWFGSGDSSSAVVTKEISGVANIERSGVGYSLKEKVPLRGRRYHRDRNRFHGGGESKWPATRLP